MSFTPPPLLNHLKIRALCTLIALIWMPIAAFAQQYNLEGVVLDDQGETLPGVSVIVKGTNRGVSTNLDGLFTIKVSKGETLVFSYVGYQEQSVEVNGQPSIEIRLAQNTEALDEVVVVGYGTQSKRTMTSAVSKVSGATLEGSPINTVGEGLKGKIAGVRVYNTNNTPGAEATFIVRGGSSISQDNSPLILVDGVERSLAGLSPNDIESIEVLKDAASSAIYGSRASNGVVLVTTKSGKEGKIKLTFEASLAMQDPAMMIDYLDATDQVILARERWIHGSNPKSLFLEGPYSSGNTDTSRFSTRYLKDGEAIPAGWKSCKDPLDPSKTLIFEDNDFAHEIFRTALWQNYYAGIQGGTDQLNYVGSVNYAKDAGVGLGTNFDRFSARANINTKIRNNLKLTSNFDYSQTNSGEYDNQYKLLSRGLMTPPTQRKTFVGDNEWNGTPTHGANASSSNPIFYEYYNEHSKRINRISLLGMLDWEPLKDWHIVGTASLYSEGANTDNFHKADPLNGTRWADASNTDIQRKKFEVYTNYSTTFNEKHSLSAMVGYSYQKYNYRYLYAKSQGHATDKIPTLNAGSNYTAATSTKQEDVNIGFFGRINYDFLKKYMLTFTFREDGSSRFADGNRWGFFPGASAGWAMGEEDFMRDFDWISNLKWRVSYGQTGNNSVGYYDALGLYALSTPYASESTVVSSTMPNTSLSWETSTQLDLGVDVGLFKNRVTFGIDYFNKNTNNLITTKTLPNSSGYKSVLTNLGQVRFRGFDLEINTRNIVNRNFSWESRFTMTYVKNKVIKLPEGEIKRDKNRQEGYKVLMPDGKYKEFGGIAEGEPLGRIYGYKTAYIITTQEQADNALYDATSKGWDWTQDKWLGTGKKAIGDYEWCDLNGDGIINGNDMYELGNTIPTTTGGLGNTLSYKNFVLDVYLDFALGHSIANGILQRQIGVILDGNIPSEVKKAWSPGDDPTKKKYAMWGYSNSGYNNNYRENSDIFVQKADYLCIREVSLSYSLPTSLIQKVGLGNVMFTLSGNNLYYFTGVVGLSPETGAASTYGSGYNPYPPIRKVSLGVRVTL